MDGASVTFLRDSAQKHHAWVAASVAVTADDGAGPARNRFVAAGPDGELVTYDKRHLFSYAREHVNFEAGDDVVGFEVEGVRVTPFVCYDLRFADEFWALANDTDCFVVPASWPRQRAVHWRALLPARAIENQCYVVGVNRVGAGDGLTYVGDSVILDPLGEAVAAAPDDGECVITGEVDAERVRAVRERYPFLRDRR